MPWIIIVCVFSVVDCKLYSIYSNLLNAEEKL